MALRIITTVAIRPPAPLTKAGTNYFSERTAGAVNTSLRHLSREFEKRVATRIINEELDQPAPRSPGIVRDKSGYIRIVSAIQTTVDQENTPVKGKEKGSKLKVYLKNQRMPWPLLTNFPIGVPQEHKGAPFWITPREDRASTAHSRTKSGRKSKRKRLVFHWRNASTTFYGPKVLHPGFGPDVLSQEIARVREEAVIAAKAAIGRSVLEWSTGGSRSTITRTSIRR